MIFYYSFDREMLNAINFFKADKNRQNAIETLIENEIKMLVFFMPLNERIVISPSFRFESFVCRKILMRNLIFIDNGIIAEYRRESDIRDFWLKKNDTYRNAMNISDAYRNAYDNESIYKDVSQLWINRIPKQSIVGLASRDVFIDNIRERGKIINIPVEQVEDVIKITNETRENTFLWEIEEYMLNKYGVSNNIIIQLGVRDAMNRSYLDAFSNQHIEICKSSLGVVDIGNTNKIYDMWHIKSLLEREGILNTILSLSAEKILKIRSNEELQNMLDIIREGFAKGISDKEIHKKIQKIGNMELLIKKLLQPLEGFLMDIHNNIISNNILRENTLRILHLSDLHFTDIENMKNHYFYLKLDLQKNFKINRIDYLIISGDVSDRPYESMYKSACDFVQTLANDFSICKEHIILVPGNHDCDREFSKQAYNEKETDVINFEHYNNRYINYSKYFFEPIKSQPYPMNPENQFEDYIIDEDGLCILALNSCWKIDHKNTEKSSICMKAIQNSKTIWKNDDYVKLAVWHHPISGFSAIQDTSFMDTLANAGFKFCLHGHIHEAKNDSFIYDANHSIKMIGAGTFGALKEERGDGIPRQYNMIEIDAKQRLMIVHTRKREKDNGTWQADARWEDKNNNPKSYYVLHI